VFRASRTRNGCELEGLVALAVPSPGLRESHPPQRQANEPTQKSPTVFGGGQPNVYTRKCRINTYRVPTSEPDGDRRHALD
jgi:hypothetical protein